MKLAPTKYILTNLESAKTLETIKGNLSKVAASQFITKIHFPGFNLNGGKRNEGK